MGGWNVRMNEGSKTQEPGGVSMGEPTGGSTGESQGPDTGRGDTAGEGPETPVNIELENLLAAHGARLDGQVERLRNVGKVLTRWNRPGALTDFAKLEKDFALLQDKFGEDLRAEFELGPVMDGMQKHLTVGKQRMRKDLGRQLKEASTAMGLKLKVISREDPVELRIPPLAVRLDLDSGKAQLLFAKQILHTTPTTSADILKGHAATLQRLERSFEPAEFFTACYEAYKMGLAVNGGKRGDRLELMEFLGHLAMRLQGKAFFVDPVPSNYRGYSRGQFAYDVNRLRLARGLNQNGKRMNFGVATGTTATKKDRVIYMEDEYGQGEYKLNIYFTEGA